MPCFILALLKFKIKAQQFFSSFDENASACLWKSCRYYSRVFCLVARVFWVICMFFLTALFLFFDTISMFFARVFCFWMVARSFYMVAYWSVILVFCSVQINGMFNFFYCLQRAAPFEASFTYVAMFNTLVFWGLFISVMLSMSNNNSYDCIIKWH